MNAIIAKMYLYYNNGQITSNLRRESASEDYYDEDEKKISLKSLKHNINLL